MLRVALLSAALLSPPLAEPYHAACVAFDPASQTIYFSDPFEQECASDLATCRKGVADSWAAFLKKDRIAQSPGSTSRCEMYREGSTPDETPRARVRKWRDEEMAQAQVGSRKFTKVSATTFEGRP